MAKTKKEKVYTEEEIYQELIENDCDLAEISQYLKAKNAGFDIYDKDIKMSLEELRNFKTLIIKNLEPVFTHSQLRELKIGFINKLDILKYANNEYSEKEMRTYRKALTFNMPVEKIKECRAKEPNPETSVQNIVHALKLGYDFDEIKNIPTSLIMYMCVKKEKDKIDILPLIKRGFEESQISTILSHNISNPYKEKLEDYVTPKFNSAQINQLGYIHDIYKYKDIKNLFNKDIDVQVLTIIRQFINAYRIKPEVFSCINKSYNSYKTKILLEASVNKLTESQKEIIKNSNCSKRRYLALCDTWLLKENFSEKYFDNKYNDVNIISAFPLINHKKLDDSILDVVENRNLSDDAIKVFYSSVGLIPKYAFKIANHIDNTMLPDKILNISNAIKVLSEHMIEVDDENIDFLIKTVHSQNEIDLIDFFCSDVDYKKINYNIDASKLTSKKLAQAFLTIENASDEKTAMDLIATIDTKLFATIAHFIDKGCNPKHLLLLRNDSNMAANMIIELDEFNKNNERKINVEEIINLKATIKEKGVLISKLISSDLDKNIEGYKMLNELTKHENVIEQDIVK